MKPILPLSNALFVQQSNRRGVALVIVLAMLVLLSSVLIAFMLSASNERNSAQASSAQATTRQVADSTLNLVMAQIRDATSQTDTNVTWASQPGAIRTFGGTVSTTKNQIQVGGGPTGAYYYDYSPGPKDYVYKLYSAEHLRSGAKVYDGSELADEVAVIENWNSKKPAQDYVDLNEPYLSARLDLDPAGKIVEPRYPIIDPRAKYDESENEIKTGVPGIVDGFDAKITLDTNLKMTNTAGTAAGGYVPYVPMPVKWLYVLKDGTIGNPSLATATNPIVGRTAFWTDDESCKLNINTASEGTFWDTPVVSTEQESGQISGSANPAPLGSSAKSLSLAASQPARFEYQRYPGHPATTCLSPALGWLWNVTPTTSMLPQNSTYSAFKEAIYQISPFTPYGAGTSKEATGNSDPGDNADGTAKPAPKLKVPTKHLYATVDELMFQPKRKAAGDTGKSAPNAVVTPSALEKVRFFLSANSRAPELNLYGRPRVTIWPIHDNPQLRTSFDDLFAFTSTIYKHPTSTNESQDKRFNLTRFDAKSDTNDYTSQNQKMYTYLQALTSKPVPGFGGNFLTKYAQGDRDQILTEIFDYIRCVNLVDTGTASNSANQFFPYTPKFYKPKYVESYTRGARSIDWSGQVTPLKIGSTMGLGRFPLITEAALIWHRTGTAVAGKQPTMAAVLALEMSTPMAGYPALRETYFTKIKATKSMQVTVGAKGPVDSGLCYPDAMFNICNVPSHEVAQGRGFMPALGVVASMHYFNEHKGATDPTVYVNPETDPNRDNTFNVSVKTFNTDSATNKKYSRGVTVKNYPYVTKAIPVNEATDKNFGFTEGEFEVEIWSGEAPGAPEVNGDKRAVKVQTVTLNFPKVDGLPLPLTNNQTSFAARLDGSLEGHNTDWISPANDVVRSIELTCAGATLEKQGDMRIAMARNVLGKEYYSKRSGYDTGATRMVHGLTGGHGDQVAGANGVGYLAVKGTNNGKPPAIPAATGNTLGVQRGEDGGVGDWDRGLSKHMDGAMANKVDEGNVRFAYAEPNQAYKVPYFHGRNVEETGQTFFTPNRQLSSAVMFGSLPTGVNRKFGWQTLLFRPDRETLQHPGAKTPEDHLLLDLFNLPVVEPYAISEPFSTAGKVNMNYVIAPFGYAAGGNGNYGTTKMKRSYLRRDTALRGVLKSTYMLCVPQGFASGAHTEDPTSLSTGTSNNLLRHAIKLDQTIEGMDARLNDQNAGINSRAMNLFRSASEICDVDLFPADLSPMSASWSGFWVDNSMTGDNMRERPYSHIYPRLTTKSNVFTVHMRCQAIKQAPANIGKGFDPVKDQVVGEYRGSAIVERFIDPNDPNLKDYNISNDPMMENVDTYYRYRVVGTKQFLPH